MFLCPLRILWFYKALRQHLGNQSRKSFAKKVKHSIFYSNRNLRWIKPNVFKIVSLISDRVGISLINWHTILASTLGAYSFSEIGITFSGIILRYYVTDCWWLLWFVFLLHIYRPCSHLSSDTDNSKQHAEVISQALHRKL